MQKIIFILFFEEKINYIFLCSKFNKRHTYTPEPAAPTADYFLSQFSVHQTYNILTAYLADSAANLKKSGSS